jgi:hypothetical protein
MKNLIKALCLAAAAVLLLPWAAWAQNAPSRPPEAAPADYAGKVHELQRVIQAQQRQLEAQQRQLEEQRKMLQALQQQVRGMLKAPPAASPAAEKQTTARPPETGRQGAKSAHQDWPGSFAVQGLKTRFAIGGFAQLDVIHDTSAITTPTEFVTASIVTRGATKAQGSDGKTSFSVNATQLWFETRTPLSRGRLRTYLSMDFFGNSTNTNPDPRLREAYGELTKCVLGGDLRAGQAWSTAAYMTSWPNILDYEGPSAWVGFRQPQVRWTRGLTQGLDLKLALETPNGHQIEGADSLTTWPDGIAALVWRHGPLRVQGTALLRDLRASSNNGPTETALGWGFAGAGMLELPWLGPKDNLTFSAAYGQGIGGVLNDQPPDAYFDASSQSLETVPVFGYYLAYEHWWNQHFSSVFLYGALNVDNLEAQPAEAYHSTQYACVNLLWMPTSRWLLGGELLWGQRVDKDGADGTDTRLQLSTKFTF